METAVDDGRGVVELEDRRVGTERPAAATTQRAAAGEQESLNQRAALPAMLPAVLLRMRRLTPPATAGPPDQHPAAEATAR